VIEEIKTRHTAVEATGGRVTPAGRHRQPAPWQSTWPYNGFAAEVPCTHSSKEATAHHGPVTAPTCSVYPQSGKLSDVTLKLAHCRFSCPLILGIACRPRHPRGNRQATSEAVTRRPWGNNSTRSPAAGCPIDNGPRDRATDQE
jgi:hypothetical protein